MYACIHTVTGLSFGPRASIPSPIGLADGWIDVCVCAYAGLSRIITDYLGLQVS